MSGDCGGASCFEPENGSGRRGQNGVLGTDGRGAMNCREFTAWDGRLAVIKLALHAVGNGAVIGVLMSDQSNLRAEKHRKQQGW
ncbi:MAG: hypothetical protein AB8B57_06370 [Congregibacter sp.]